MFPPSGPISRYRPSHAIGSLGLIRRRPRYYGNTKTPSIHPSPLRFLRGSVPSGISLLRLSLRALRCRPPPEPGFADSLLRLTFNRFPQTEMFGSPRFLDGPPTPLPYSRTPAAPVLLLPFRSPGVVPAHKRTKTTAFIKISRLYRMASALAVYASDFSFPTSARLASGGRQSLSGGYRTLDPSRRIASRPYGLLFQRPRLPSWRDLCLCGDQSSPEAIPYISTPSSQPILTRSIRPIYALSGKRENM